MVVFSFMSTHPSGPVEVQSLIQMSYVRGCVLPLQLGLNIALVITPGHLSQGRSQTGPQAKLPQVSGQSGLAWPQCGE